MSVVDTCSILLGVEKLSDEQYFEASALGWMIELLQAYFLVVDDIMDGSQTRRGQPCWYKQVGLSAANDGCLLSSCIYILLRKYFRKHKNYMRMVELFHEVSFQTEIGQACDLSITGTVSDSWKDKYGFIAIFKTSYYSFYLPVALALLLCDLASEQNLQTAKDILLPMGEYFQIQDDYLDNFADASVLGKVGTDIQENKCSWLVIQALRLSTAEQRKVLEENYGQPGREREVKRLYDELELQDAYQGFEERRVRELQEMIAKIDESGGLKREAFTVFLKKIYKRSR
ncbi:Polyprenyl synthetase [Macrophomina phaseolina MS6]|uniref:Polyprenyl synthetase n=2 Tax=Macrophomina phaseolina TaxID=35725 RepID=K2RTS4_MACPH|nr:Polyprenyl synthetase [Macrophomina phaseolina MS6]